MFAEWIVDVILLQVGLKCCSMRMIFAPLYKLLHSEMLCFLYNRVWQSWYSEINFVLLHQYGSPRTCLIIFNIFGCQHTTFCGFVSTYRSPRTRWICDIIMLLLIKSVLDNWVLVLVRFVGCLNCFLQHQDPNYTSNYLYRHRRRWSRWHIYFLV